jgi:hypothetical protein
MKATILSWTIIDLYSTSTVSTAVKASRILADQGHDTRAGSRGVIDQDHGKRSLPLAIGVYLSQGIWGP